MSHDPRRLFGAALVALHDPSIAAVEARYAVEELAMKSVVVRPNPVNGRTIDHPDHDEFFAGLKRSSERPRITLPGRAECRAA
jgi:hypothetical protein